MIVNSLLLMMFISKHTGFGSLFIFTILSFSIINIACYDLFHSPHLVTSWHSVLTFFTFAS